MWQLALDGKRATVVFSIKCAPTSSTDTRSADRLPSQFSTVSAPSTMFQFLVFTFLHVLQSYKVAIHCIFISDNTNKGWKAQTQDLVNDNLSYFLMPYLKRPILSFSLCRCVCECFGGINVSILGSSTICSTTNNPLNNRYCGLLFTPIALASTLSVPICGELKIEAHSFFDNSTPFSLLTIFLRLGTNKIRVLMVSNC